MAESIVKNESLEFLDNTSEINVKMTSEKNNIAVTGSDTTTQPIFMSLVTDIEGQFIIQNTQKNIYASLAFVPGSGAALQTNDNLSIGGSSDLFLANSSGFYKWPTTGPTVNQVLSVSSIVSGDINLEWVNQSGGGGSTPGGVQGSVQYNDNGSLGGSSTFLWEPDSATFKRLLVATANSNTTEIFQDPNAFILDIRNNTTSSGCFLNLQGNSSGQTGMVITNESNGLLYQLLSFGGNFFENYQGNSNSGCSGERLIRSEGQFVLSSNKLTLENPDTGNRYLWPTTGSSGDLALIAGTSTYVANENQMEWKLLPKSAGELSGIVQIGDGAGYFTNVSNNFIWDSPNNRLMIASQFQVTTPLLDYSSSSDFFLDVRNNLSRGQRCFIGTQTNSLEGQMGYVMSTANGNVLATFEHSINTDLNLNTTTLSSQGNILEIKGNTIQLAESGNYYQWPSVTPVGDLDLLVTGELVNGVREMKWQNCPAQNGILYKNSTSLTNDSNLVYDDSTKILKVINTLGSISIGDTIGFRIDGTTLPSSGYNFTINANNDLPNSQPGGRLLIQSGDINNPVNNQIIISGSGRDSTGFILSGLSLVSRVPYYTILAISNPLTDRDEILPKQNGSIGWINALPNISLDVSGWQGIYSALFIESGSGYASEVGFKMTNPYNITDDVYKPFYITQNLSGDSRMYMPNLKDGVNDINYLDYSLKYDINSKEVAYGLQSQMNVASTTASTLEIRYLAVTKRLVTVSSLSKYKDNQEPIDTKINSEVVYQLQQKTWITSKLDLNPGKTGYGYIAEEVEQIEPKLCLYKENKLTSVNYDVINLLTTKETQKLHQRVTNLEQTVQQLQQTIQQLQLALASK